MTLKNNRTAFVLLLLFASYSSYAQKNLSVAGFESEMDKADIQILDVRTQTEYNTGHLKNAFLADWTKSEQFEARIKSLDKSKPVYVYCLSGGRSSAAARRLTEAGFTKVYNLQGGIKAWKEANKKVEGVALVKAISMDEYLAKITEAQTVLVDISAVWCPPCQKMEPVLKELQNQKTLKFALIKIDGGAQEKLAADLGAAEFPTFIIYKNGKEFWRHTGLISKEELMEHLK